MALRQRLKLTSLLIKATLWAVDTQFNTVGISNLISTVKLLMRENL